MTHLKLLLFLTAALCWYGAGCAEGKDGMTLTISSPAFGQGKAIPAKHTCDGENVSPALAWTNVPAGTRSFAVICDDPDAPGGAWVHWVFFNIPATTKELPENISTAETLPSGAIQGINDFHRSGYAGPCPPSGKPHRYFFRVYALDSVLSLKPKPTSKDLVQAMQNHILAQGELVGTYERKPGAR